MIAKKSGALYFVKPTPTLCSLGKKYLNGSSLNCVPGSGFCQENGRDATRFTLATFVGILFSQGLGSFSFQFSAVVYEELEGEGKWIFRFHRKVIVMIYLGDINKAYKIKMYGILNKEIMHQSFNEITKQ